MMEYKTKIQDKSQSSMPKDKSGAGSNENEQHYGNNQAESARAGVKDQKGLDDGRPHGDTGKINGGTTGRPSGKPANLFDK